MKDIEVTVLERPGGTVTAVKKYKAGIKKRDLLNALVGRHGVGDLKDAEDYDIEPSDDFADPGAYCHILSPSTSAGPQLTVESITKAFEDATAKLVRAIKSSDSTSTVAMSSIATKAAVNVLQMTGFCVLDGSVREPLRHVAVPDDWKFNMGLYAREEDCYEPFFTHIVRYLGAIHSVKISKDPPFARGGIRLLDVHKSKNLDLEAEIDGRLMKITGSLDAVFVPPRYGPVLYADSMLGCVEIKHSSAHEGFKYGAATGKTASRSDVIPQALMEALAVYAYSDYPVGIFLVTSFDDNAVMELKDGEILYWTELNFAQAMEKIAGFFKREDISNFLEESEQPAKSRKRPLISESKRSVRRKLKIGVGGGGVSGPGGYHQTVCSK